MDRDVLTALVVLACLVIGPLSAEAQSFTFSIENQTVLYDPVDGIGAFDVAVEVTEDPANDGYPVLTSGFAIAVENDPLAVIPLDAVPAGDIADLNSGDGPETFLVEIGRDNEAIFVTCFYGFDPPLLATLDGPIAELSYELNDETFLGNFEGSLTDLVFVEGIDPSLRSNLVFLETAGGGFFSAVEPDGADAVITIDPADDGGGPDAPEFLRGDADGSGSVSALLDALRLLGWTFAGGLEPTCMDAADADDNGVVSALLDSLFLLSWAFAAGDVPPDPGPTACGPDPGMSDDGLGCETTSTVCTP